ncbi:MAG TPA: RDD family protein [Acidimicrobiales bacterium]
MSDPVDPWSSAHAPGAPAGSTAPPVTVPGHTPAPTYQEAEGMPRGFTPGAQPDTWTVAGLPLSSAGRRLGSALLDSVLFVVLLGIGWVIWSLIVWSKGQSPAKSLLNLRCVHLETQRAATWGRMALRELVGKSLIGALTVGISSVVSCFMILGPTRQGVWDKVAGTAVVDDPDGRLGL